MYHFTALVTCLAIAFYFFTSIQVSKARVAFGIKVPATAGNPDFERVFRVQMNTLEWVPIFLPSRCGCLRSISAMPSPPCWAWSGSPAASFT